VKRRIVLVALLAAVCSFGALAQNGRNEDTGTRSLEGVVADSAGKPVADAVVQLKDSKTLQIRSFITQQDGAYHFAGLSKNNDYEVRADRGDTSSGSKTLSVFDARKVATINLKLK